MLNYAVTKAINIEGGYATMFSTSTMASPKVKNVSRAAEISSWAYVMISIRPADFVLKTPSPEARTKYRKKKIFTV